MNKKLKLDAENKANNQVIMQIIQDKKLAALKDLSVEELEKFIK